MNNNNFYHIPVMLEEAISHLKVKKNEKYIDATLGGGGHTSEILKLGGVVLSLDIDMNAISYCQKLFKSEIEKEQLIIANRNFREIDEVAKGIGWKEEEVSGILYDLGVSTFQIKKESKGFSFDDNEILDMRMDESLSVTANDLIGILTEKELSALIRNFGEESHHKKYAKIIKELVRKSKGRVKAKNLAEEIKASTNVISKIHPATRVFQALRIAVNSELESLEESLGRAPRLLKPGGRLVLISFHSLEDKIAKNLKGAPALKQILKKPITSSLKELESNPSARSAKLRVYEKLK